MKTWQFCMIMGAIYIAPIGADRLNVGISAVFLLVGLIAAWKERP